jgi:hypothetical protein
MRTRFGIRIVKSNDVEIRDILKAFQMDFAEMPGPQNSYAQWSIHMLGVSICLLKEQNQK